jgi:hypothetical protein
MKLKILGLIEKLKKMNINEKYEIGSEDKMEDSRRNGNLLYVCKGWR